MMAWVRPVKYDVKQDRGIIMNKESSYEFGLQDDTGALQGAASPGCWRWFGTIRIPLHEWTHVAVSFSKTTEHHFVSGVHVEADRCINTKGLAKHPNYGLKMGETTTTLPVSPYTCIPLTSFLKLLQVLVRHAT